MLKAAEVEADVPAGGVEGLLVLRRAAHPQLVRHLEGVPAAALACQTDKQKFITPY